VTGWTPDELTVLARTGSLRLTAGDEPGPEVELGMVIVRCALYVRGRAMALSAASDPGSVDRVTRPHGQKESPS
jgi:hypothetical protein